MAQMNGYNEIICQHCKTKLSWVMKSGFLGCNYCYATFEQYLDAVLPKIQIKTIYKGKQCDGTMMGKQQLIDELKDMIDFCANEQRYADAEILNRQLNRLIGEE